jgi:phosphonate metabolism-associated iron-containing alcohol dehydrogenase
VKDSKYYNPVKVVQTSKWFDTCEESMELLGIRSPLILTSNGGLKRFKIDSRFPKISIYSDVTSNPDFESCRQAIGFCRDRRYDGIIAIGGGSVMDTAKSVEAADGLQLNDIRDILENTGKQFIKRIPSIFIPTTHGTGGEVTMWSTVWDMSEKKKYSISHPELYPDLAILDASLTLSLPLDISLITVLDALSHSFEAIWNKNANPRSTELAVDAICLILQNVFELKRDLNNIQVRKTLLEASCKAGLAFSNTKTAAAHSISYPLTAQFNIPHGIAASLTLLPLLKINKSRIECVLKEILGKLKLGELSHLVKLIEKIPGNTIKYTLKEWGVSRSQLDQVVAQSFTKGRMENNIIDLTEAQVRFILDEVYS